MKKEWKMKRIEQEVKRTQDKREGEAEKWRRDERNRSEKIGRKGEIERE